MRRYLRRLKELTPTRHNAGIAAMEFAMVTPIFAIILAGVADLGGLVTTRFRLDTAVAAASNYVLVHGTQVSSTNGAALATSASTIVTTSDTATTANGTVVINNGPTVTVASGTSTSSGTASNADLCYCPTGSPSSLTWGAAVACGSTCTGGGLAGKFVLITANYTYTAIFTNYSFINGGVVNSGALVQVQ
jgi:Flp pilus assembly protein TadG